VTTVLYLPTHVLHPQNFVRVFCNDSEAILSRMSALCPGDLIFLSEIHLKEFANHIPLVKIMAGPSRCGAQCKT